MKLLSLIFLIVLTVLPAWGQAPIRRQFFTTNTDPIVEVVAGSNATVQASTPAANIRRFTVNGTGSGSGQTNDAFVAGLTNVVVVTNSSGGKTLYSIGGLTDTNIVTAIAQAQTNGLATTNVVWSSQVWTNDGTLVYPKPYGSAPYVQIRSDTNLADFNTYLEVLSSTNPDSYATPYSYAVITAQKPSPTSTSGSLEVNSDNGPTARAYINTSVGPSGPQATLLLQTNGVNTFSVSANGDVGAKGTYYGNGAGLTNLVSDWAVTNNIYYPTNLANSLGVGTMASDWSGGSIRLLIVGDFTSDTGKSKSQIVVESTSERTYTNDAWVAAVAQSPTNNGNVEAYFDVYGKNATSENKWRIDASPALTQLQLTTNGTPVFTVNDDGDVATVGTYYGNGAGITNLPAGVGGSSNITDSAYYAVARNVRVNTNAEINNLVVTNLTVDSGSGIGYLSLENSGTNIIELNGTNGYVTAVKFIGDGSGLTNLPSGGTGSSNITDSGYVAVARNLTVSTNTTFAGSVIATNGYTSTGTNVIYSLWSSGTDYERYLFEPEDTQLTIRADTAGSGDDNLGIRIITTGTGAFYLENSGQVAGNARGVRSVDLQMSRSYATQVASGHMSFCVGNENIVSGDYSGAIGVNNFINSRGCLALGELNQATYQAGFASGYGAVANKYGQFARGSFVFNFAVGTAQYSIITAGVVSASNTATNMWMDNVDKRITLPANTSWSFQIQITARSTDAGTGDEESAAYEIKGLIERDNSAAATRIVGSPVVTTLAEDDALWDVSVTADTTNGALQINVQGNNETAVRWVATVHLTEVGG